MVGSIYSSLYNIYSGVTHTHPVLLLPRARRVDNGGPSFDPFKDELFKLYYEERYRSRADGGTPFPGRLGKRTFPGRKRKVFHSMRQRRRGSDKLATCISESQKNFRK